MSTLADKIRAQHISNFVKPLSPYASALSTDKLHLAGVSSHLRSSLPTKASRRQQANALAQDYKAHKKMRRTLTLAPRVANGWEWTVRKVMPSY
jgi:hypothetical protein